MSDYHSLIRRLAGDATFAKGEALLAEHAVIAYDFRTPKLIATVQDGEQAYQVTLRLSEMAIDGGCTCPVSDGFDVCEHYVAAVLFHDQQQQQFAAMMAGTPEEKVSALLQSMPKSQLESALLALIQKDKELLLHWSTKAEITADQFDLKSLQKWIVKALPLRAVWRYELVRKYFDRAREQFALINPLLDELSDIQALHVCEFALARYDKVSERIEDSGAYRLGVETMLLTQLVKTFQRWDAAQHTKVAYLLDLYASEHLYVDYGNVGKRFIAQHDTELQQAFYAALEQQYATLDSSTSDAKAMAASLTLHYAEQDQWELALPTALKAYLPFSVKFDLVHQAIHAEQYQLAYTTLVALKQHALPQDLRRINQLMVKLNQLQGDDQAAMRLALEHYAQSLDVRLLEQLVQAHPEQLDFVISEAEQIIRRQPLSRQPQDFFALYLAFEQLDKALEHCHVDALADDDIHALALQCLLAGKSDEAVKFYLHVITHNVELGAKGYAYVIEILTEIHSHHDKLKHGLRQFNQLIALLHENYPKKHSFTALLTQHFSA
jgi:uncharacterized Zn finger protein